MEEPRDLEELKADVEARQRNILWEDARHGGRSVDEFLWKGDPNAKQIQRAALVIFGLTFLLIAIVFAFIPFQRHFDRGWSLVFFIAFIFLLISLRLFRNACLRSKEPADSSPRQRER